MIAAIWTALAAVLGLDLLRHCLAPEAASPTPTPAPTPPD
jgi:hypothetical protein